VKASIDIVQLTNEDNASNGLVVKYREGKLDDIEKRQLAGLLNQYGYELQTVYGFSKERAAEAVQSLLNGGAFVAAAADAKAYNEALSYLKGAGVQYSQAAVGTDALLALPGAPGALVRGVVIAGGSWQAGTDVGQIIDGDYGDGALNVSLGSLAIFGGYTGNKVIGKQNGGIVSPESHIWQENTLVKYPYYDKPQIGGTLNIGAGNRPIEGAYNISHPDYPKGSEVHAGDANNLSNIATGSQKTIVMENPYGFKPFNDEILRVLDKNGTIIVTGSWSNNAIKNIEKISETKGFDLVGKNVMSSKGFLQSDGNPINNPTVTEYKFKRK